MQQDRAVHRRELRSRIRRNIDDAAVSVFEAIEQDMAYGRQVQQNIHMQVEVARSKYLHLQLSIAHCMAQRVYIVQDVSPGGITRNPQSRARPGQLLMSTWKSRSTHEDYQALQYSGKYFVQKMLTWSFFCLTTHLLARSLTMKCRSI